MQLYSIVYIQSVRNDLFTKNFFNPWYEKRR